MTPEQRLWIAVVNQVFADATSVNPTLPKFEAWAKGRDKRRAKKGLEPESEIALKAAWDERMCSELDRLAQIEADRDEARRWLLGKVEGMESVCDFAGVSPDYVKRLGTNLSSRGWNTPVALAA